VSAVEGVLTYPCDHRASFGDTNIEDLFVSADEPGELCTEVPLKKIKLPVKRKRPH
jgi:hypothetical protein